jgi:hypothetical protein
MAGELWQAASMSAHEGEADIRTVAAYTPLPPF